MHASQITCGWERVMTTSRKAEWLSSQGTPTGLYHDSETLCAQQHPAGRSRPVIRCGWGCTWKRRSLDNRSGGTTQTWCERSAEKLSRPPTCSRSACMWKIKVTRHTAFGVTYLRQSHRDQKLGRTTEARAFGEFPGKPASNTSDVSCEKLLLHL